MKKIILIFAILIYSSCTDAGKGDFYKYSVENRSGKIITIKSYRTKSPDLEPIVINLEVDEILTKTHQDGLPPTPYAFGNYFGMPSVGRDSLKIIYNNEKVQFLKTEYSDNISNPLNFKLYIDIEETFIFTIEDYENAEDCNGDCE